MPLTTTVAHRVRIPSLRIGRVLGVPIVVSASWLAFAAIVIVVYGRIMLGADRNLIVSTVFAVAMALMWGLSVVIHELGHVVAGRLMHSRVFRVEIGFLGGVTITSTGKERPAEEFWVSIAGPVTSLILAAPGLIAVISGSTLSFGWTGPLGLLAGSCTLSNLIVAAFNMLPGLPLDGGRVLAAALWRLRGNRFSAIALAGAIGQVLAAAMVIGAGVLAAVRGMRSEDIIVCAAIAVVAAMLWVMATDSRRAARRDQRLDQRPVTSHLVAASTLDQDTPVPLAAQLIDTDRFVVTAASVPVGIAERRVLHAAAAAGATGRVEALMRPIDADRTLPERSTLYDVLVSCDHTGATDFVVTARDGTVLGLVLVDSIVDDPGMPLPIRPAFAL